MEMNLDGQDTITVARYIDVVLVMLLKDETVVIAEAPRFSNLKDGDIVQLEESGTDIGKGVVLTCEDYVMSDNSLYQMLYKATGQDKKYRVRGLWKYIPMEDEK